MATSAFDIRELPNPQRFHYWRDAICQTYFTVDCQRQSQDTLEGFIDARTLGELSFSQVSSPAMVYTRGANELKKSHEEYFQLVLVLDGDGAVEQGESQTLVKPGDMVVYSSTEHSKVIYPEGSITQVVKIPRSVLADRIDQIDMISATLLNGSRPIGALSRNLIQECMNVSLDDSHSSLRFSSGVLDILATAIEGSLPIAPNPKCAQALAKVKQYIEQCLPDPELDVRQIAESNSMSVRTLNRLFASEGTTTMRWVWNRRIANSRKILSEGKMRRVSQVAFDCGFNDLSHFSKAFKRRYGVTPQHLLRNPR